MHPRLNKTGGIEVHLGTDCTDRARKVYTEADIVAWAHRYNLKRLQIRFLLTKDVFFAKSAHEYCGQHGLELPRWVRRLVDDAPGGDMAASLPGTIWVERFDLETCRRVFEWGNVLGLMDALTYCWAFEHPLPNWAKKGAFRLIAMEQRGNLRLPALSKVKAKLRDYGRYASVLLWRSRGIPWVCVYDFVSSDLKSTPYAGGQEAIKKSYMKVVKAFKNGRGEEFYCPEFFRVPGDWDGIIYASKMPKEYLEHRKKLDKDIQAILERRSKGRDPGIIRVTKRGKRYLELPRLVPNLVDDAHDGDMIKVDRFKNLETYRRVFERGNVLGLMDALACCSRHDYPLPKWAVEGALYHLAEALCGDLHLPLVNKVKTWLLHISRYDEVLFWQSRGIPWDDVYDIVSRDLAFMPHYGGPEAIKKSYIKVVKAFKNGRGEEFYRPEFFRVSGDWDGLIYASEMPKEYFEHREKLDKDIQAILERRSKGRDPGVNSDNETQKSLPGLNPRKT